MSRALSVLALALIGGVFVLKYSLALSSHPVVAAVLFVMAYTGLLLGVARVSLSETVTEQYARGAAGLLLCGAAVLLAVRPDSPAVARAPAIAEWLGALHAGVFPYCQPTRPSGLPGLFLLAAPFWALGVQALVPVAGLVLALYLVWTALPTSTERLMAVVALGALPALHYETLVSSELFANLALALGAVVWAERARERGGRRVWVAAVVLGLVLATRMVVPVVAAVYFGYAVRHSPRRTVGAGALALAVGAGLVLPFWAWDPERFVACGPFHIQGLYLPAGVGVAAGLAALALGATAPNVRAVAVRAGGLLTALVALSFGLSVAAIGWTHALWRDGFDISYFILGVPFLVLTLAPRWGRLQQDGRAGG